MDRIGPPVPRPADAVKPLDANELESTVLEMIAQAKRGHPRFCLGYHQHDDGQTEEEWVEWSVPFGRLLATARASVEAQEGAELDEEAVKCRQCGRWHSGINQSDERVALCEDCDPPKIFGGGGTLCSGRRSGDPQ